MKKIHIILILVMFILVACNDNNDKGIIQVDFETVQQFTDGEKNGFFLAVSDKEENFISNLESVANDKEVSINYYYTYEPEGENGEVSEKQGRSKHPKISTIQMYCNGCGITLAEFFDSELFKVAEVPQKNNKKTTNETSKNQ